jgi:ankyrin repeat protein
MSALDREGRQPLHYAALDDDAERVTQRVEVGDDLNLGDTGGFTPLHLAAQQMSVAAARELLDRGAQVDPINIYGNTPLFIAVFNSRGRGEMIALLRERGADPYEENNSGQTPTDLARLIGNYDVAQFFCDLPRHAVARLAVAEEHS